MKKIFLVLSLVSFAFAQDYTCLDCHSQKGMAKSVSDSSEVSLFFDMDQFQKSIHADLECTDCHLNTESHPNEQPLPEPACIDCHDDANIEYAESIHGKAHHAGSIVAATCWDCHGTHDIIPHGDHLHSRMLETCGNCHSTPEIMSLFGRRNLDPIKSFQESIHGKIFIDDPEAQVANCVACHGGHDIKAPIEPDANLNKLNIPKTCGQCHVDAEQEYYQSIHWISLKRGRLESPVCTDCHGEHNIHLAEGSTSVTNPVLQPTKLCANCHSSETMMGKYGLDSRRLDSYMKSYHGLAILKGSPEAATCTSCHEVHSIRGSRDSLSTVHTSNLVKTCAECHTGVTPEFARIDVHPVDQQSRNPIAYIFRNVYIWLIIVVIGGMFIHNVIIVIHHIREKRKQELNQPRIQRFQSWEVYQHLFMLTSFILLAITGFALKFPDAGWVKLLVSLGMTEAIRSMTHRVSAVIMSITSIIQLGYFILSYKGRRDFLSMLPNIDDVTHLWQNMRLHLGLSKEKPQFGRYDYGEKAEYLALIWGVVVMGVTGFVLWFPEFFIGFLPSWVFETAEVIHYFEAWLATLAIIVWHWFFVIYHPDNYPVNTTFLDGKITEENLKHHHPAEYERLKAEQTKF